jgi:hypothetical protein
MTATGSEVDELNAVAYALTAEESARLLAAVPRMVGAHVHDVLAEALDYDAFIGQTEPFFEAHADDMPDLDYAPAYAAYALLLMGERLTVPAVLKLLWRAGVLGDADEARVREFITAEVADELQRSWGLAHDDEPALDRRLALQLALHATARLSLIRTRDHIDPLS